MEYLFELDHVSFTYEAEKKKVLEDISMEIEEGGFYILCGRSGCGKSTLLRQLKSVLTPKGEKEGEIRYRGMPLAEVSARIQSQEIGFVFQNPEEQIVTDQVWHELSFGLENLGCTYEEIHLRVAEAAGYFGLEKYFNRKISELSGGQKQLLSLASVLVLHPKILLLDEPFAQLDPLAASDFLHTLLRLHRELGITILMSEHHLEEVFSYADKIFVMENGRMSAEGNQDQIGVLLQKEGKEMFLSMPTPLRVSAWCGERENFPYTIAGGQNWMKEKLAGRGKVSAKEREEKTGRRKDVKNCIADSSIADNSIELKNVWFRYEKTEPYLLKELSVTIKQGEIFSLLGGNGAGKSTLLRMIAGFLPMERGKIFIKGKRTKENGRRKMFPHLMGFLPQEPELLFVKDTVLEDLMEMASKEQVEQIAEQMDFFGLLEKHPFDLSCGERQKAAFAKVLLSDPEILLLDEPTKSLDAFYKRELGRLLIRLRNEGKTILMVSHDMEFCAAYADRVGLYFQGNVEAVGEKRNFFSGNYFYATAANRMAGVFYPDVLTAEEIVARMAQELPGFQGEIRI